MADRLVSAVLGMFFSAALIALLITLLGGCPVITPPSTFGAMVSGSFFFGLTICLILSIVLPGKDKKKDTADG